MATHDEVAHAWANQTGRHRKGFSMYYDGPTIYSWGQHFPIARHVTAPDGERVVLFTSNGYSVSTGKHKNNVHRAIPERVPVFIVSDVLANTKAEHRENYNALIKSVHDDLGRASRARLNGDWFVGKANDTLQQANLYTRTFRLGRRTLALSDLNPGAGEILARVQAQRAEVEAQQRNVARELALKNRDRLRRWLAGEDVQPPHTRVPMVRVRGDVVQTTWGASVPLADALKLWASMKTIRGAHLLRLTEASLNNFRVGDFQVNEVTRLGARVGCHFIPYRFALCAAKAAGIE